MRADAAPRYDVGSPTIRRRASRHVSLSLEEKIVPTRSVSNYAGALSDELTSALRGAAGTLRAASLVTIVCHENPDADTLGGGLALARALHRIGISAEIVCATGWPSTLAFLPQVATVKRTPTFGSDAIVLVDCATIDRAGPELAAWIRDSAGAVINVDHHASNDGYGTAACIDRSAAATSEVIARLLAELGCPADRDMATLILAGILHDTDGLRVPETSASTLRLTADLVEAGADIAAVTRELFGRRPLAALHLWGRVASRLETSIEGRVVIGTLTSGMLTATGAALLDAEDLPELIASAQGAEIALLLRQLGPKETRVSIRTSGGVDAAALAMEFGGGGHGRAAGCTMSTGIGGARDLLLAACERHLAGVGSKPAEGTAPDSPAPEAFVP